MAARKRRSRITNLLQPVAVSIDRGVVDRQQDQEQERQKERFVDTGGRNWKRRSYRGRRSGKSRPLARRVSQDNVRGQPQPRARRVRHPVQGGPTELYTGN